MPITTFFTAEEARQNVKKFEEKKEQERLKKVEEYVGHACQIIKEASKEGKTTIIIKEMELITEQTIAEKILTERLRYEVKEIPGKGHIKISWEK